MLFLESPAIVGFSTDKDYQYHYNDEQTANDAFMALKDFLHNKAPEFKSRDLFVIYKSKHSYLVKVMQVNIFLILLSESLLTIKVIFLAILI